MHVAIQKHAFASTGGKCGAYVGSMKNLLNRISLMVIGKRVQNM